jgi:hypothetical protein
MPTRWIAAIAAVVAISGAVGQTAWAGPSDDTKSPNPAASPNAPQRLDASRLSGRTILPRRSYLKPPLVDQIYHTIVILTTNLLGIRSPWHPRKYEQEEGPFQLLLLERNSSA